MTKTVTDRMRFLPINETHLLVELASLDQTIALQQQLMQQQMKAIYQTIPAAKTILIHFNPSLMSSQDLIAHIRQIELVEAKHTNTKTVDIIVDYNGEDLAEVAQLLDLSVENLIKLHCESTYVVAFTGFAPGFAYLTGGHPKLDVPRRASPRTQIPAGAVGLAGTYSGVYPQASPGGWQIIGVTEQKMFDIEATPPALLQPGFNVRFHDRNMGKVALPVKQQSSKHSDAGILEDAAKSAIFEITSLAMPVFYQDMGRPNMASQGISTSGALDQEAFHAANKLVGNCANQPVLEITLGGLELKALEDTTVALTGALSKITIKSQKNHIYKPALNAAFAVEKDDTIKIAMAEQGVRSYLAARGGFAVNKVLESAATDTLANLGPKPLAVSDKLYTYSKAHNHSVALPHQPSFAMPDKSDTIILDVYMGPRTDWFTAKAVEVFLTQKWQVSDQSNRIGLRLLGEQHLERAIHDELPSEGTPNGAIQIPANGQPVLFLADHPLTGGYPVIACIAQHHLDLAAQIPVGAKIQFHALEQFSEKSND